MRKGLTPFGVACRAKRALRGLVMADQAKAFRCSVSYISAIERGEREIPSDFPDEFGRWLELPDKEISELRELAAGKRRRTVVVSPSDSERDAVAEQFAKRINSVSREQLQQIRSLLNGADFRSGLSPADARKIANCARACFEVGSQLVMDIIDILENRVPEVDSEFFLQVSQSHNLDAQIAGYAEAIRSTVKKIVLSEHIYEAARAKKPDAHFIVAHEFSHWLLDQGGNFQTYPSFLQLERDIDRIAREFLMPEHIAQQFGSPKSLAFACNVPTEQAEARMKDLGLWPVVETRDRISKGFSQLLSVLKKEPLSDPPPNADFKLIPFPNAYARPKIATSPRRKTRKQYVCAALPLFEYVGQSEPSHSEQALQGPAPKAATGLDYYAMLEALANLSRTHQTTDTSSSSHNIFPIDISEENQED